MLVNNFYNMCKYAFASPTSAGTASICTDNIDANLSGVVKRDGTSILLYFKALSTGGAPAQGNRLPFYNTKIIVGTGSTPEDINNYNLAEPLNIVQSSSHKTVRIDGENKIRVRYDVVVTNSTNEEITIREVGLLKGIYINQNAPPDDQYCLMERSVLETPITVGAGETTSFIYDIVL